VALIVFGAIVQAQNAAFFRYENLILVAKAAGPVFIVSVTMTFVLVGGGIDLSVGSVAALGGVITALALTAEVPIPLAILAGLLACAVVGLINGLLVARAGIPPLIVTLGALYAVRGMVLIITDGVQIFPLPGAFNAIAQGAVATIPYLVIYGIVFGILGHIVLEYSTFGYRIRALGGNAVAARGAGIQITRLRASLYVISALGAGLAGILATSRFSVGDPVLYQGFELVVISAVIVGGTSLFGAIGRVTGTALGVILLGLVTNGLQLMRVTQYFQPVVLGAVVVGAVAVDRIRRTRIWRVSSQ
jgi:ribose transport system permease protein